jgi:tetratricopeptide (TPR) repeat protein
MAASKFDALKCFDRALDLDPAHYWALIGRAEAYIELKKFPEAVADAERAIVARPRSPRGRCLLARIHSDGFHDPERALAEFDKAIAIDPEDPITYCERSSVHSALMSFDKSLEDTTRALELEKTRPSSHVALTLVQRGWALLVFARYDEALSDARQAIEIEPQRTTGYQLLLDALSSLKRIEDLRATLKALGERVQTWADRKAAARACQWISWSYYSLGEYELATAAANRAIELDPMEAYAGIAAHGWAKRRQEGAPAAEPDCDLIAKIKPEEPRALRSRGWGLWALCNQLDAALADFARAIEIAPAWADVYYDRGLVLQWEHRYDEALADYDKTLDLAPKWVLGFQRRAFLHENLEHWQEALADLERYFALGGGDPEAYMSWRHARALAHVGREKEARAALDQAIKAAPRSMWGYLNRADILFSIGRLDEAFVSVEKAVQVEPNSPSVYLRRAWYLAHKAGACSLAEDDLKKVQELTEPSETELKSQEAMVRVFPLGFACPQLIRPAQALTLAREVVKFSPKTGDYQQALGAALYANGDYDEAKPAFRKALELHATPNPMTLFFLAMTESKLGRNADARRTYDRAVARMNETWPRSPDYILLRREAAALLGIQP